MIEPGLSREQKKTDLENGLPSEYTFHTEYAVKNENGSEVGINILIQYYGELWKPAIDRITGKIDGHLFAILHNGYRFDIYRKCKPEGKQIFPPLRLIRS
ncbi:MAG: hypothetical protein JRF40_00110 [Deltaproteobacteria bacterium]|nr:hypothetical protein [Deltaproteobacteria bacterium]MBW2217888.1 hypothetical protein [Deltaproteobacteria bacterium]